MGAVNNSNKMGDAWMFVLRTTWCTWVQSTTAAMHSMSCIYNKLEKVFKALETNSAAHTWNSYPLLHITYQNNKIATTTNYFKQ